ncbi:MAG: peptidoglycan DD-metalloendopeptidase family protein [Patescibacteria group bacterium]|nr:peptidoglycan DD-metalloendopeptidase family protein [Patescibacteria group bacterium]
MRIKYSKKIKLYLSRLSRYAGFCVFLNKLSFIADTANKIKIQKKINKKAILSLCLFIFAFCFLTQYNNDKTNLADLNSVISQQFNEKQCYANSTKHCEIETPELYFIQGNSVKSVSPPTTVTPQILGSLGATPETQRKAIIEHIIETGDTISSIAKQYNISTNTILWANDLNKNSVIQPGKKLAILPVTGVLHIVKSKDTLSDISAKYKINLDKIVDLNKIENEKIFIGDILIIPNGKKLSSSSYIAKIPLINNYFVFPCIGRITQELHWYNAVDIANKCGTPIYATANGTIQKTGYINRGGNRVRIIHPNKVATYYGHLSKILVKPGEQVKQGQKIGIMGNTGRSTGCHLHYAVIGAKNPLVKYKLGDYISWK